MRRVGLATFLCLLGLIIDFISFGLLMILEKTNDCLSVLNAATATPILHDVNGEKLAFRNEGLIFHHASLVSTQVCHASIRSTKTSKLAHP